MAREEAEIKELIKKLAQNPDSMVFVQLADAYRRAGDLAQSVEVCQQGLERHPTYTTARAILGRNYLDLGKLAEAEAEFHKIEVSDPENIMAHRMLGQIFMQKGQFADAIARQQRVLSLDPEDSTAQELLQEALVKAKQLDSEKGSTAPASSAAQAPKPEAKPAGELSGTLKVADIYIKKGALDEAAEVLQEVLAVDPDNSVARQKLQEVNERRGVKTPDPKAEQEAVRQKAEAEEKLKAEKAAAEAKAKAEAEAARKKADEEAKAKADAEAAKKKADEEAKAKADAEAAKKKADEEAKAKADAEAAKKKADEEAQAKAEAEAAKKKADEEAKAKADAEKAAAEEKAKAEAEAARKKAEEQAAAEEALKKKQVEEAKKREEEEKERKASKLSGDDILSVMASDSGELIDEDAPAKPAAKAAAAPTGIPAEAKALIEEFLRAQAMEASLLLSHQGAILEAKVPNGDAATLGATAAAIFSNTEKAAKRMAFGGLKQIMVVGEDGRQILFLALKAGILVALTGKNTNLGLLRVALNDLAKKA